MVDHFAHLRFRPHDHEDWVQQLTPYSIPELRWKLFAIFDQSVKQVVQRSVNGLAWLRYPQPVEPYLDRTSRSSPVMRTSWKANSTGNQYCSSSVWRLTCCVLLPCEEGEADDNGHSGVLSIIGIMPLRVSIACSDFFWNLEFFEKSVRQTTRSGNAPCDMITPSLVLYIWRTFSYAKLTIVSI